MAQTAYAYRTDSLGLSNTIYRAIIKMIQRGDEPGENIYDISYLYRAKECYKLGDYEGLERIYDCLTNPQQKSTVKHKSTVRATSLIDFFRKNGLEVIDKRSKGGCLWVVGSPAEINTIVREACRMFGAGGNFAMNGGRATGYRTAWFTQCSR